MRKITVLPLQGIIIEGTGTILLGQTRADVEKLLGPSSEHSNKKQLFYDNYECRIDFSANDTIEFIEFIYGPYPERSELSIYGIDPFRIGADKLIEILTEKNAGPVDDDEAAYCYSFLNISVGVWRQITPESVEESIAEMKEHNEYEENKGWLEKDLAKAKNFWTIGIGVEHYYQ